jgi:tRNA-specific 2-thiouridylase
MKPKKVLVAMSGGVDSSVAALLMKKKGYEVIGAFMKNWSETKNELGECVWKEDRKISMKIAAKLRIPLITLDFEREYKKYVIDEMFKNYRRGITPNPDIDCNQKIKFPLLWKAAKKLGADFIATGHYARIKRIAGRKIVKNKKGFVEGGGVDGGQNYRYELLRAKDESKDQSYFLYRLNQKDLRHSLFPIGDYTKTEIRKIAEKNKFPNFNRKGTVGICFVGKVNLKDFLQKKIKPRKGKTLNPGGKQIGEHDGIYYYTIGQRLGPRFGIKIERGKGKKLKRWYVARKNLKKNEIIAAPEGHPLLYRREILIKNPHWINEMPCGRRGGGRRIKSMKVKSRIRHVGELLPLKLKYNKKQYKVTLNKPITGVSKGQAIVLYSGKKVLGGGVIGF